MHTIVRKDVNLRFFHIQNDGKLRLSSEIAGKPSPVPLINVRDDVKLKYLREYAYIVRISCRTKVHSDEVA